ncbi:MAG: cytochrome b/b6 domain-containing protein [Pseudomonadota bacterium]
MSINHSEDAAPEREPVLERIWDAPTRLLKWSIAGFVAATWAYGFSMSFETIGAHMTLGYIVAGLVGCRLLWGLVGPKPSRLITLARDGLGAPRYARSVLKPEPSYWPGHNPMGSLWLIAMLTALSVQIGTGLISYSDSFFDGGPLAAWAGSDWNSWANNIHDINSKVIIGLIGLHILVVFFYAAWKMEDLIGPMISGWKLVRRAEDEQS